MQILCAAIAHYLKHFNKQDNVHSLFLLIFHRQWIVCFTFNKSTSFMHCCTVFSAQGAKIDILFPNLFGIQDNCHMDNQSTGTCNAPQWWSYYRCYYQCGYLIIWYFYRQTKIYTNIKNWNHKYQKQDWIHQKWQHFIEQLFMLLPMIWNTTALAFACAAAQSHSHDDDQRWLQQNNKQWNTSNNEFFYLKWLIIVQLSVCVK